MTTSNRISDYLAALPAGIKSYPDFMVKLSVVQTFVSDSDVDKMQALLPESFDLQRFLAQPSTLWVPEVQATMVYLAVRDACFETDDAFVDEALKLNHRILEQSVFRAIHYVLTRGLMVQLGVQGFRLMHNGIDLIAPALGAPTPIDRAQGDRSPSDGRRTTTQAWELHCPPFLVPPLIGRCYATALQAAAELSKPIEARTFINVHSPTIIRVSLAVTTPEPSP